MDWSGCKDVERDRARVSGAWVIKDTRVQADAVVENAQDGYTAEEIAAMFPGVPVERVRGVIRFARAHEARSAWPSEQATQSNPVDQDLRSASFSFCHPAA
jgi:uncharacterized protein (DUF433 family)